MAATTASNTYFCKECGFQATKKALMRSSDNKESGLGTWRCSRPCKSGKVGVRREKNRG